MTTARLSGVSPDEVLNGLAGFAHATVLTRISAGPTGHSWLLERDGKRYVLRVDNDEVRSLGLDRRNERRVCEAVAAAGLAPVTEHFDWGQGIYLRRWQPGRAWSPRQLKDKVRQERLAGMLRRLHALRGVGTRFEPGAAAARYAARIGTEAAHATAREAAAILADLRLEDSELRLCHNDLVCENIIECDGTEGGRLWLIDWEYAALGDPYFDLAVLTEHHQLARRHGKHLLDAYHDGQTRPEQRERHRLQCAFYRRLLSLWEQRIAIGAPAPETT